MKNYTIPSSKGCLKLKLWKQKLKICTLGPRGWIRNVLAFWGNVKITMWYTIFHGHDEYWRICNCCDWIVKLKRSCIRFYKGIKSAEWFLGLLPNKYISLGLSDAPERKCYRYSVLGKCTCGYFSQPSIYLSLIFNKQCRIYSRHYHKLRVSYFPRCSLTILKVKWIIKMYNSLLLDLIFSTQAWQYEIMHLSLNSLPDPGFRFYFNDKDGVKYIPDQQTIDYMGL